MDKINEVLEGRVKALMFETKGLSQADIARSIDEKPQTFGNYVRGRTIPASVLRKWKAKYKEDLEELAEAGPSTNVSRGNSDFRHQIFEGDYVGLHKRAWDELEKTLKHQRKIINEMVRQNGDSVKHLGVMVAALGQSSDKQQ